MFKNIADKFSGNISFPVTLPVYVQSYEETNRRDQATISNLHRYKDRFENIIHSTGEIEWQEWFHVDNVPTLTFDNWTEVAAACRWGWITTLSPTDHLDHWPENWVNDMLVIVYLYDPNIYGHDAANWDQYDALDDGGYDDTEDEENEDGDLYGDEDDEDYEDEDEDEDDDLDD